MQNQTLCAEQSAKMSDVNLGFSVVAKIAQKPGIISLAAYSIYTEKMLQLEMDHHYIM